MTRLDTGQRAVLEHKVVAVDVRGPGDAWLVLGPNRQEPLRVDSMVLYARAGRMRLRCSSGSSYDLTALGEHEAAGAQVGTLWHPHPGPRAWLVSARTAAERNMALDELRARLLRAFPGVVTCSA